MKAGSSIKMIDLENYKEVDFFTYQGFIRKLMYFSYSKRLDIAFIIRQFSRYNADPRKDYF